MTKNQIVRLDRDSRADKAKARFEQAVQETQEAVQKALDLADSLLLP